MLQEQYVYNICKDLPEIEETIELINNYRQTSFFPRKDANITAWEITQQKISELIISVFTATLTNDYLTYQALVGMLNYKIKLDDEIARIEIIADIIGLISLTGLIVIESIQGEYHSISTEYEIKDIPQEDKHKTITSRPQPVEYNWSKETGSVILGHKMNHHNENVRLSHLQRMEQIPLQLCKEFINKYEETPKKEPNEEDILYYEKINNWELFKEESSKKYDELIANGNKYYLKHKYDCRGRCYAGSYYINPQGSSYKKAIVQLANEEMVTI